MPPDPPTSLYLHCPYAPPPPPTKNPGYAPGLSLPDAGFSINQIECLDESRATAEEEKTEPFRSLFCFSRKLQ